MIGSLFAGIGGLELGLERAGLGPVIWQVEKDPLCREVLAKHWPQAKRYDDVSTVSGSTLAPVDVLCGGFPCQPVSLGGKRKAQADPRWLWPHFSRLIGELRPRFVVAENVLGLRTAGLLDVLRDLAALGYDALWHCATAAQLGAPHLRRRIFILAADAGRVNLREQPGRLARAFERATAPVPGDVADASARPSADTDALWRLEQVRRVASGDGLAVLVGSSLTWREWMMGFPYGWARLEKRTGTRSFRSARKSSGE